MSLLDTSVYGAVIGGASAAVATPVAWRALSPLPHVRRVAATNLACVGVAGLAGLACSKASIVLGEVVNVVTTSAALQGVALLVLLLFFSPQRP
jgi:hypothetical protein